MVSSTTWGRRGIFRAERWAKLLVNTLYHYRGSAYLLHEFVVMPDHFHAIVTPLTSLEKSVQFIKGGFSYRAKKELGSNMEVWQKGFSDHRIRDAADYAVHVGYVHQNPVKERLCANPEEYPYSSAHPGFALDPIPQRLKTQVEGLRIGGPEGPPIQSKDPQGLKPVSNERSCGAPKGAPFQRAGGVPQRLERQAEGPPFQSENPRRRRPCSERGSYGAAKTALFQGLSSSGEDR